MEQEELRHGLDNICTLTNTDFYISRHFNLLDNSTFPFNDLRGGTRYFFLRSILLGSKFDTSGFH